MVNLSGPGAFPEGKQLNGCPDFYFGEGMLKAREVEFTRIQRFQIEGEIPSVRGTNNGQEVEEGSLRKSCLSGDGVIPNLKTEDSFFFWQRWAA